MNNQLTKAERKPRQRTCKSCKKKYVQQRFGQVCCSPLCAAMYAREQRERREAKAKVEERKKDRAKLVAMKPLSYWRNLAQRDVNAYVRERDKDKPCISCGRFHNGQWHAGHYLSRGAHPELALEPRNIHKQCAPCNNHLSGNQANFRKGLIERIGVAEVEWLEGPHEARHYTVDDYKAIGAGYREITKVLQRKKGAANELSEV